MAKNDSSVCDQPNMGKFNSEPEIKRETQVSAGATLKQNQNPSHVSFISHRASVSLPKSTSLAHHVANSPNMNEIQVHDAASASSAAKHVAIQPPPGSLTQVIDSCPKERLSCSNLNKANNKV